MLQKNIPEGRALNIEMGVEGVSEACGHVLTVILDSALQEVVEVFPGRRNLIPIIFSPPWYCKSMPVHG